MDFTAERQRHDGFVGREDVLARLDEWLLGSEETRWVAVTGGPGMGKSAILSVWIARREAAGAVVPHHLVRRQVADWDQPDVIAVSLAAQIEDAFPDLCDPAVKPERRLIELLGRVSQQLGSAGRLVIVVDGLDETCAEPGDNPLPRFLPHVLPSGVRLLCATRPTYPHLSWLEAQSPLRRLDLDDVRWADSNEVVVRGFWESAAPRFEPPLPAAVVAAAIESAEGNVLHAVMLRDALRDLSAPERRADRSPRGLKRLIGEIWDRAASRESVRAGLGLLCAAREALPLDTLAELASWSYEEKERFARDARQLLLEEPASWAGVEAYRPRHDWVRELMGERLGAATMRVHHGTLARTLATWPAPAEEAARRYALRYALVHRAEAGDWADAWCVAADARFLEAKCRELGVHEAEADVAWAADRCRSRGDEGLGRRLGDLAQALARESHWLQNAPEAVGALLWNRLRRLGWSASDLDEQLRVPAEPGFLRIRHHATCESSALVRNLVGHAGPVRACAIAMREYRSFVISASWDRTLRLWDLEHGFYFGALKGHTGPVYACVVTGDGQRVISASGDHTLKVWGLESQRELTTLAGHTDEVRACAVTPDGRRVVSASSDGTLKVWDLDLGREIATLGGHSGGVNACAVTRDGRCAISASTDGTLKIWDIERGRELVTLEGHAGWVNACAVTVDDRRVVSASGDGTLKVWELDGGRELATLEGHTGWVWGCTVAPDGRRVISTSEDRTLRVWDLESGRALTTLEGHAGAVRGCAVTADGRRLISASADRTLKVWDL
ncbi:MAG TPA: AAA family ATPase, partial [Kofleriaceae bacterium]|nr:AAA family ATPase [Kofleriaceae bacterium]